MELGRAKKTEKLYSKRSAFEVRESKVSSNRESPAVFSPLYSVVDQTPSTEDIEYIHDVLKTTANCLLVVPYLYRIHLSRYCLVGDK